MSDVWIDWSGDSPDYGSGLVVCNVCGLPVGGIEHTYQAAYERAVAHAAHPDDVHGRRPLTVRRPEWPGILPPILPSARDPGAPGRGKPAYVLTVGTAKEIRRRLLEREKPAHIGAELGVPLTVVATVRDDVIRSLLAEGLPVAVIAKRMRSKILYVRALQEN